MTMLLAITGGSDGWAPERWRERLRQHLPEMDFVIAGVDDFDPAAIRYAAVWKPTKGYLATLPRLSLIFNLGAGVDAVMADPTLPDVPLVRVATDDLTNRMSEYVLLHVLMAHRRQAPLASAQKRRQWDGRLQWAAKDLRVGVMGLGVIGTDAVHKLAMVGFNVAGWSRTPRSVPGIACFDGAAGLDDFLARSDVLVVLLPLTAQTRGIVDRVLLRKLPHDGPLGAPVLINAGRGGLQIEDDILAALDDGTLGQATLDVFNTEPLPSDHPLWSHPRVTITPHNAADSDAEAIAAYIAAQIRSHECGAALANVVDRTRGY
ncbi:2-hydroxyacid dehydrogenase [Candidatus Raskinella chloraquaticus]|uniref:Glyoxylate/hydroxypyruvate reductase A n=1 Tax=Candidatus Raskinella chloraquaticus TaxID=1951219 RepID=A0A1W9HQF1_9HYPH|nr:MAG: glyoxylate/hydroxypyruvate reductase A [Proteobacteria bacterium SG_bin8]